MKYIIKVYNSIYIILNENVVAQLTKQTWLIYSREQVYCYKLGKYDIH